MIGYRFSYSLFKTKSRLFFEQPPPFEIKFGFSTNEDPYVKYTFYPFTSSIASSGVSSNSYPSNPSKRLSRNLKRAGCRGKIRENLLRHMCLRFTFTVPFGGGWITFDWSEDINWSPEELNDNGRISVISVDCSGYGYLPIENIP
jgi:hypothetical protein